MSQRIKVARKLRINEISAVDQPVVEGAVMTLLKRNSGERVIKAAEEPDTMGKAVDHDALAATFEQRINEIKKRDKCSATEAMFRAYEEYPVEYEAWQTGDGTGHGAEVPEEVEKALDEDDKATITFEQRINEIKKRDGCSAAQAMEAAVTEYPAEFAAWQYGEPVAG